MIADEFRIGREALARRAEASAAAAARDAGLVRFRCVRPMFVRSERVEAGAIVEATMQEAFELLSTNRAELVDADDFKRIREATHRLIAKTTSREGSGWRVNPFKD